MLQVASTKELESRTRGKNFTIAHDDLGYWLEREYKKEDKFWGRGEELSFECGYEISSMWIFFPTWT